jgi:uncharacterized protein YcgL (UPF0745 family)
VAPSAPTKELKKMKVYVVSSKQTGWYLYVDNTDQPQWIQNIFSADKFLNRDNAERSAKYNDAEVVEIPEA